MKIINKKTIKIIKLISITFWLSILSKTDSYYVVYAFIGVLFFSTINCDYKLTKTKYLFTFLFSFIFSVCVTLANYNVAYNEDNTFIFEIFTLLLIFISSLIIFFQILKYIACKLDNSEIKPKLFGKNDLKHVFIYTFIFITIIDLLVLFICIYPGVITQDSIKQINQIETGIYSNHHPYWHTLIIGIFYNAGKTLFGNSNAGIATYFVFQIIAMALIEAYANDTLFKIGVNKKINILFALFFALIPYNLFYSFTMWKDVLFGGFILLFIVSFYRIINNIGNNLFSYIWYVVSCFGFCLFRSNGWYGFVITTILLIIFYRKFKKVIIISLLTLIITFFMQNTLITKLGVTKPDLIESLSIPSQQIARVIVNHEDCLTNEQSKLLNKVIEVEKIKDVYEPWLSDNVKDLVREKNNQSYLKEHINEYLKLYLNLGFKYPLEYIKAWIDQTRGFFNGGYDEAPWSFYIYQNNWNIGYKSKNILFYLSVLYGHLFTDLQIPRLFISVGLHVWLVLTLLFTSILKKNKLIALYTMSLLSIVLTLFIATPNYCDLRYVYSIFTTLFFIVVVSIKEYSN